VVHVLTQKGRGYSARRGRRREAPARRPGVRPDGRPAAGGVTGYTQAFAEAIIKEAEADSRVVAITAAMPGPTGLLPFQARFPDRFFDVGIAEQHAVTGAAGMAMGGLRPVVAIYSTFLNRAWDQVVYDVAMHRLPVVFCLDRAGITGPDGASHHGVYDMALLAKVPGMRVLAPSSAEELQVMLHDAIALADEGPVVIRWPRGAAVHVGEHEVGTGLLRPQGARATARCASWPIGKMVADAQKAADRAGRAGHRGHRVGRALLRPARPGDDRRRCRHRRRRHGRGRHPRRRHRHDHRRPGARAGRPPCPSPCWAFPARFIPQGSAERILAQLGLDCRRHRRRNARAARELAHDDRLRHPDRQSAINGVAVGAGWPWR
jgi:transketolase C-terminal domain/subunit